MTQRKAKEESQEPKEEVLAGGVTKAQIAKWKKDHGDVFQIDCEHEGKTYTGYFRKIGMAELSAAAKFVESDPFKSGNILFDSTVLACDPEMKSVDEIKVGAISKLNTLFKIATATVKKL